MTIEERAIGSVVVLDVSGRLVLGEGDQLLKDRIASHLQKGNRHVLLNVSKLSYVDSSGLGVIVASFLAARTVGGALRLVNPPSRTCAWELGNSALSLPPTRSRRAWLGC